MTSLVNQVFGGENRRISAHLLERKNAQLAENCDMSSGSIVPITDSGKKESIASIGFIKTIHQYFDAVGSEKWLQWPEDVNVIVNPIAGDTTGRSIFTGTDQPRVFDSSLVDTNGDNIYPEESALLIVPTPTTACVAALGAGGSGGTTTTAYVYTFVRIWPSGKWDEGAPSPASNSVDALAGQTVNLSAIENTPHIDHRITHVNIYRIATGNAGAEYEYVDQIPIGTTTYADNILSANLGEVIPSENWTPPPETMEGIILLSNGCAAGFSGNEVLISVPYQLHAYPVEYRQTINANIVALCALDSVIVVITDKAPTIIYANDPASIMLKSLNAVHPCKSKRGVSTDGKAVYYPVAEGLLKIDQYGTINVFTEQAITEQQWLNLKPETMHGLVFQQKYFLFYEADVVNGVMYGGGLIFDLTKPLIEYQRIGYFAHAMHSTGSELYLLRDINGVNTIYQWGSSGTPMFYTWRSKNFRASETVNFSACKISCDFAGALTPEEQALFDIYRQSVITENTGLIASGESLLSDINAAALNEVAIGSDSLTAIPDAYIPPDGVLFKLFADDAEVYSGTVLNGRPFRLPDGYLANNFYFELTGQLDVYSVSLADSLELLR